MLAVTSCTASPEPLLNAEDSNSFQPEGSFSLASGDNLLSSLVGVYISDSPTTVPPRTAKSSWPSDISIPESLAA